MHLRNDRFFVKRAFLLLFCCFAIAISAMAQGSTQQQSPSTVPPQPPVTSVPPPAPVPLGTQQQAPSTQSPSSAPTQSPAANTPIIDCHHTYDISVLDNCTGKHTTVREWDWLTSARRGSAANAPELRDRCRGRTGPSSTPDYTSSLCDHTIGSRKWKPAKRGTRVGAGLKWS